MSEILSCILSKKFSPVLWRKWKRATTYWYHCSQRKSLAGKHRKHQDVSKHRNTKCMARFDCNGIIKITINEANNMAKQHDFLHKRPSNTTVSQEIKDYIKENIDLLPREIYAWLVAKGLDISIRANQIHFWWTQIGQNRYKRHEDAFQSAIEWLQEGQCNVFLNETVPVRAIAFMTGIYEHFRQMNLEIRECGIDATCKYLMYDTVNRTVLIQHTFVCIISI